MAHVVIEPSRRFSFILANRCDKKNPYEGAVSIIWPDAAAPDTRLFPYNYPSSTRFATDIANVVQQALNVRRPYRECTWSFISELLVQNKIEKLRRDGKAGIDEYIRTFDEERTLMSRQVQNAEIEIGRLRRDLALRSSASRYETGLLLTPCDDDDLYSGEIRDVVIKALDVARKNVQPAGRLKDILDALLKVNIAGGECTRLETAIRDAVSTCTNIGPKERSALEDVGFNLSEEGKHIKLIFRGDDRYTFIMPKTGSDWRGMKNWVSDTTKRLFH